MALELITEEDGDKVKKSNLIFALVFHSAFSL
jgi:hypothetical protein